MSEQNENIRQKKCKNKPKEILDQKTTMKNLLGLKGQFEQLKERISELEDKTIEIFNAEEQSKKKN